MAAVILGAGASSRMGTPKLLLPWGPTTLLEHLFWLWDSLGARPVTLVCPPAPHPLLDRVVPGLQKIVNPSPADGMFSSIRAAARWDEWAPELTHFALTLGDEPLTTRCTLERLLNFARDNIGQICQPHYQGRPKHPVIFPRADFHRLAETKGETLREFLAPCRNRAFINLQDPGLGLDLDTPEEYKAALARRSGNC